MSDQEIVAQIRKDIESYSSTVCTSLNHLMEVVGKNDELNRQNKNDIIRIEAVVENLSKVVEKVLVSQEKTNATMNEIALGQSALSSEYRRVESDRARLEQNNQSLCDELEKVKKDYDKRLSVLEKKMDRIHWTVSVVSAIAAFISWTVANYVKIGK